MDLEPRTVTSLRSVLKSLRSSIELCAAIPSRVTARLRSRLTKHGATDELQTLEALVDLEAEMLARHERAKASNAGGMGSHANESGVLSGVVPHQSVHAGRGEAIEGPATDDAGARAPHPLAPRSPGSVTGSTATGALSAYGPDVHARLLRKALEAMADSPQLCGLLQDATALQSAAHQHANLPATSQAHTTGDSVSSGAAALSPPTDSASGPKPLATGLGLPFMLRFLDAMEEVLEDRLTHSTEHIQKRRAEVEDAKASVHELSKRFAVEQRENSRLASRHRAEEDVLLSRVHSLHSKLRSLNDEWEEKQTSLRISVAETRERAEEAHREDKEALESHTDGMETALQEARAKHTELEEAARIKQKRGMIELRKAIEERDRQLLTLRSEADILEAEVGDQEAQIDALQAYLGLVQAEHSRNASDTEAFEARVAERRLRKRLLTNGAARLIGRNLRLGVEYKKEMAKAAKKKSK